MIMILGFLSINSMLGVRCDFVWMYEFYWIIIIYLFIHSFFDVFVALRLILLNLSCSDDWLNGFICMLGYVGIGYGSRKCICICGEVTMACIILFLFHHMCLN